MRLYLLCLIQCLLLAGGQLLLKAGLNVGRWEWSWTAAREWLLNWRLALCGACFALSGVLWVYIVKTYPLSKAYPLEAMSFVFGVLGAWLFLGESVGWTRWMGVALIVLGCMLVLK